MNRSLIVFLAIGFFAQAELSCNAAEGNGIVGRPLLVPPYYHFIDLGVNTRAVAINSSGLILGNYGGSPIGYTGVTSDGTDWQPYSSEYNASFPVGLNDAGQAVGGSGRSKSVFWQADGQSQRLIGDRTFVGAIGQAGAAYGIVAPHGGTPYTFRWKAGVVTQIPGLSGYFETFPNAINRPGDLVGWAQKSKSSNTQLAVWRHGDTWQRIGTLGGKYSDAWAINDAGTIVGCSTLPGETVYDGFIYQNGVMKDVGSFGGNLTEVTAINNQEISVGGSRDAAGMRHPFVYIHGTLFNLEDWMDSSGGLVELGAFGINDSGEIIGLAADDAGNTHGWAAIPE